MPNLLLLMPKRSLLYSQKGGQVGTGRNKSPKKGGSASRGEVSTAQDHHAFIRDRPLRPGPVSPPTAPECMHRGVARVMCRLCRAHSVSANSGPRACGSRPQCCFGSWPAPRPSVRANISRSCLPADPAVFVALGCRLRTRRHSVCCR